MTIITYPAPGEISDDTRSTDPSVGSVFLSEVRRCEGVITRALQGVIGVRVTDPALIPSKMGMNTVADDTVTLEIASPSWPLRSSGNGSACSGCTRALASPPS